LDVGTCRRLIENPAPKEKTPRILRIQKTCLVGVHNLLHNFVGVHNFSFLPCQAHIFVSALSIGIGIGIGFSILFDTDADPDPNDTI
jgi:hypothetical protein